MVSLTEWRKGAIDGRKAEGTVAAEPRFCSGNRRIGEEEGVHEEYNGVGCVESKISLSWSIRVNLDFLGFVVYIDGTRYAIQ